MHRSSFILLILFLFVFVQCKENNTNLKPQDTIPFKVKSPINNSNNTDTINPSIMTLIEIPAGSLEKWEMNKTSGIIERDSIDGRPRTINYLGYPANYGMIPETLLSKEKGGDGDPLDIMVLGPSVKRGSMISCKIIGVLYLKDNGEQDDKLIAVAKDAPLYHISNISELNKNYPGSLDIIELWFTHYKGSGEMVSMGYGDKEKALQILLSAKVEYARIALPN